MTRIYQCRQRRAPLSTYKMDSQEGRNETVAQLAAYLDIGSRRKLRRCRTRRIIMPDPSSSFVGATMRFWVAFLLYWNPTTPTANAGTSSIFAACTFFPDSVRLLTHFDFGKRCNL